MVKSGLVFTLVVVLSACARGERADAQQSATPQSASTAIDARRRTVIVDASAKVAPAVVSIHTVLPAPQDNSWMAYWGQAPESPQGFGTGFITRADGIIVTNEHVVEGAEQITVTLADGTEVPGRVLGEDPVTDIAVVKIDKTGLPVVEIGKSSDLMIGEWAIALGNPYTYLLGNAEPTVTAGVISATGRNIFPSANMHGVYVDMIQTDAAINPGNSGGPLVNALGQVIGVNSSIFSSSGGSVGLGFAIPIERATRVAAEIIATGSVSRAWPGLDVATSHDISDHRTLGVNVQSVVPGGPAARAGIHVSDVLLTANGRPLRTYLDWEVATLDLKVGDIVTVSVRSGNTTSDRRIVTSNLPTLTANKVRIMQGLDLVTVTPAVQAERGLKVASGALVYSIKPDIAAQTGIAEGDVIIGINQQALNNADDVAKALGGVKAGQPFYLWIDRNGARGPLTLRLNQ
jgi:serine protease Do